ncbi:MAG: selenium-dependent molybdenum cofactor biosynthesis protein YqeB [Treponema sp.]|nr:selenium-dependent molybdenum cofactor biosynthesis protein YqeB [Treponema sp.]
MPHSDLVIIRGGGDLATGVVQKFWRSGLAVLVLEAPAPTAIRRTVSLCEAVYDGRAKVEDVECGRIERLAEIAACRDRGLVPLLVDPFGESIGELRPLAVVDAVMAKRNLGTRADMAPAVLALGPGFRAGTDAHAVIETCRGHDLGRLILQGEALPDTGIPGEVGGKGAERVVHSPAAGAAVGLCRIGDLVEAGQPLCRIEVPGEDARLVPAPFAGLLRGLIRDGLAVHAGMKIADVDPRTDVRWQGISDKARCVGGAALEGFFYLTGLVGRSPIRLGGLAGR